MKQFSVFLLLIVGAAGAGTLTVLEPDGSGDRIAEGQDYASYEIGDAWDMSQATDVRLTESRNISSESIAGGVYAGTSTNTDPNVWLVYPGVISAFNQLERGHRFPIDTSVYRHFSMRIRFPSAGAINRARVLFFEDETAIASATFGQTTPIEVQPGAWQIVTADLVTDLELSSDHAWTDVPLIRGLRLDPTSKSAETWEIDWVRLTAEPLDASTSFTVQWSGNSGNVSIEALDGNDTPFSLATGVGGSSAQVDLAKLFSGPHRIRLTDGVGPATSSGAIAINSAPQINITNPDASGDVLNSYAQIELGNPWGPFDPNDVDASVPFRDLINISYSNPAGSLSGEPTGNDPGVLVNTPVPIDTQRYRMLTYTLMVDGPRSSAGSVARILWGNNLATLTTGDDILVQEGLNTYAIGDMRDLEIEGGMTNQWFGSVDFLRIDPHEFPCPCSSPSRDIRLDSMRLAPLDTANPILNISWDDFDPDDNADISFFADADTIPGSGNEVQIASGISENDSANAFAWNGPLDVAAGEYQVYALIDDGRNTITRYATGAVNVGAPPSIDITVLHPDGIGDDLVVGQDFSREVRGDAWEMDNALDVLEEKSKNISSETLTGGIYSGTSASADPQFWILFPGPNGESPLLDGNNFPIDTSVYRYLTAKIRYSGAGPHFFQVFYFEDNTQTGGRFGISAPIPSNPGDWQTFTIDLMNDVAGSSPNTWNEIPMVRGLRIDPTSLAGATFEIDWITLTAEAGPESQCFIQWTADDLGVATISLTAIDSRGDRLPIANGLDPTTTMFTHNFARLPLGDYFIEVAADPGPVSWSAGPHSLIEAVGIVETVFADGFESP